MFKIHFLNGEVGDKNIIIRHTPSDGIPYYNIFCAINNLDM